MFEQGLLAEVQRLMESTRPLSQTARQALGYKEVMDWIKTDPLAPDHERGVGEDRPGELIKLIQTRTRQFSKRQQTWFRNLEECVAIACDGREPTSELCDRIASRR